MTRTDYEQSVANKLGIINALKDNVGDEFTALEISAAMIDPPDLKPLQIGAVLKSMVAEGLVSKRPSKNMNVYRLTKKALAWTPPPYDWRAEGAMATPPENAAEPVAPQDDNPMEASSQPAVDNSNSPVIPDSSPLPTDSREDEPLAQPKITPAAVSGCGGNGTCGGHCANHAHASDLEELAEAQVARLTAQLSELTKKNDCFRWANANLTTQLSDAQSKLADALADLATSQREQDRLHQRLREQDRQRAEDQNRIDALMDVARPHLAKGKHGDTARAAAPFGLPVIPKYWIGLLKLTLLDDNAKLVLKIDSEGGGAYARLKADAVLDGGSADFLPGVMDGLIGLMDYLFPHLAVSHPDHSADTGNMVMTSEARQEPRHDP